MGKAKCEVLVLGKTGVGKSSFINYLYGENIRASGTGRPKTKLGIFRHKLLLQHLHVNIYDSWGLEADKTEEWHEIIDYILGNATLPVFHNYHIDKPKKNYFHIIFYCISASGSRVENLEIQIINKLLKTKNQVSVILTKADIASEKEIEALKKH